MKLNLLLATVFVLATACSQKQKHKSNENEPETTAQAEETIQETSAGDQLEQDKNEGSKKGSDLVDLDYVDRGKNPRTPSEKQLRATDPVTNFDLTVEHLRDESGRQQRVFFKDGDRYSGWALTTNSSMEVSTKFTKYVNGISEWEVNFFDTGELSHDLRKKGGLNYGHQRIWRKSGEIAIEGFYSEPGKAHGIQRSWHKNGTLARDGEYDHGELIYDVRFDEQGAIIDHRGDLPKKYK